MRIAKLTGTFRFHDIRARSLTDAAKSKGMDYAQQLGGHREVRTTAHYVKERLANAIVPHSSKIGEGV
jgi:integrase